VAREAEIVAQAGRLQAVTISTNMAGRGTDIILGGNAETLAWARLKQLKDSDNRPLYPTRLEIPNDVWTQTIAEIEAKEKMKDEGRKIAEMGGLHIVGTERHESRRIDNQLRGRAGRQGDPGSGRFYLSLEDELMRLFGGERLRRLMNSSWIGMQDGEALESGMLTRQIEKAQKKVEEYHFEQRKNLLEYDEVMDFQRKRTYGTRQSILDGKNPRVMLLEMIESQIAGAVNRYGTDNYGAASFAQFVGGEFGIEFDPADFKGSNYDEAVKTAQDRAITAAPTFLQEVMEENLNPDEEPNDWKWQELSRVMNTRYGLKTTDRDLKKVGPEAMSEYLLGEAEKSILAVDLSGGKRFLDKTYAAESLRDWARQKFGLKIPVEDATDKDPGELTALLTKAIREAYRNKDVEFPVQVGLAAYLPEKLRADRRPDRDQLFRWAQQRFPQSTHSEEIFRTEPRSKVKESLIESSKAVIPAADYREVNAKLDDAFRGATTAEADDAAELVEWCKVELKLEIEATLLTGLTKEQARDAILNKYDAAYRPEMRDVERRLILDQLDSAWKSHLLTMDHLRHVVGLSGYAQEDPKIVYKREGMKLFDAMWEGVNERVSESVFRVEDVGDEEVQSALWAGARAQHQQAESALSAQAARAQSEMQTNRETTNAGASDKKAEPIRNVGAKVGRNDPCPCGSGKKYKNCHMKMEGR